MYLMGSLSWWIGLIEIYGLIISEFGFESISAWVDTKYFYFMQLLIFLVSCNAVASRW